MEGLTHEISKRIPAGIIILALAAITLPTFSGCARIKNYIANKAFLNGHHARLVSGFDLTPVQPGDVVFLGDSITEGGHWSELFPGVPTRNRGILGDTTEGVIARLGQIVRGKPARIFILIGTNDIGTGVAEDTLVTNFTTILDTIRKETPQTKVFIQSILPRERGYAKKIKRVNLRLQKLATEFGFHYVDIFPLLADKRGALKAELTNDGLHLLGSGYRVWSDSLKEYLRL